MKQKTETHAVYGSKTVYDNIRVMKL